MINKIGNERSWVEINLSAFSHNLKYLKSLLLPNQSFLMIVKADAYGHGASEISRVAIESGAVYLGVANPEEGKLLRIQNCHAPILVLSPSLTTEIESIITHNLTPSVSDYEFALALNKLAKEHQKVVNIHLKVDTGMHRSGVCEKDFISLYNAVAKLTNLNIEGVFSHFAASENDTAFSTEQEESFFRLINKLPVPPKYIHIDNSNAVVSGFGKKSNLVRLGILAYGVNTSLHDLPIEPVMTFKASLSQVKAMKQGDTIGYNRSWIAPTDGKYGIIPIGYADGYDYLLSNCGTVIISTTSKEPCERLCKVIGRISMDMITIDLSDVPDAAIGDVVTLVGAKEPSLRAESLVANYGGNPYELLCQIGRRAKRHYYSGAKLLHSSPLSRRDFVPDDFNDSKLNLIIESAIAQRLQSVEIGELIYREILRSFFYNKDKDIHYRYNFHHEITFEESLHAGYYRANTTLCFDKILQNDYFIVACAASDEVLQRYIKRSDVEYRWLMDDAFELNSESFEVSSVMLDGIKLKTEVSCKDDCLEIKCSHPDLKQLVGKMAHFSINTQTVYPKASHQLSVFITELTRGVFIAFRYPAEMTKVECVPVFSGQDKFPLIVHSEGFIELSSKPEEWIFPISGIVFSY
ncbi:MAG: alanine racemase [Candidatus Cloacimonetes bacterium HGW-Cloacimonetes-3]|jgi:alanine racemase|nr:MAG: alanine racemase [Candidatus Cloacimonetes bacterium HGW-Cloacimonetes-3]